MTLGSEIRIGIAVLEDVAVLAALGKATFVEKFGHLYKPDDLQAFLLDNHTQEQYLKLIEDDRYRVWLAHKGNEPVGYAVAGPCTLPVEGVSPETLASAGEIKRLYILSSCQGGGLGQKLMGAMSDWLIASGYAPIYLSVYADNHGAQRFYQRYGFSVIQQYEFKVGEHRDPELIMQQNAREK
ncbi:MAG: GNAT family N-acetyltransferase [Aquisalinus sp.]|nr:GNAT family N-acetyltransferase [Aquisalinus sp.]